MPESVAIIYERFTDREFIGKFLQFMVLDEDEEEINFDTHRFRMFKVTLLIRSVSKDFFSCFRREFFAISAWSQSMDLWIICMFLFVTNRRNKKAVIELLQKLLRE